MERSSRYIEQVQRAQGVLFDDKLFWVGGIVLPVGTRILQLKDSCFFFYTSDTTASAVFAFQTYSPLYQIALGDSRSL